MKKRSFLPGIPLWLIMAAAAVLAWCAIYSIIVALSIALDDTYTAHPKGILLSFTEEQIGHYTFDPRTILGALEGGEAGLFAPAAATPSAPVVEEFPPWHQSDYLKVTNAVFQQTWGETIDSWSLYSMSFDTPCRDAPDGYASGDLFFFKPIAVAGQSRYAAREVMITPALGLVSWGGGRDYPRPRAGWKSADLKAIQISAEDALRIAEDNGGISFRQATHNECDISLMLEIEGYSGWRVGYSGGLSWFTIKIDPYTGRITDSVTSFPGPKPTP